VGALSPSFVTWQVLSLMDTALLTFLIAAASWQAVLSRSVRA
jgi:hypothetical protein